MKKQFKPMKMIDKSGNIKDIPEFSTIERDGTVSDGAFYPEDRETIGKVHKDFETVAEDFNKGLSNFHLKYYAHKEDLKNSWLLYVTAAFAILDIVILAKILFV